MTDRADIVDPHALANDLRQQAREAVLVEAREAYFELERSLLKLNICPQLTTDERLKLTLVAVRLRLALGIRDPITVGGMLRKREV